MRSFTRLLAAGQSVMGIKKHPGPYRMNQDHLLPRFEPIDRPAAAVPAPTELEARPPAAPESETTLGPSASPSDDNKGAGAPKEKRPALPRRWLARLLRPFASKASRPEKSAVRGQAARRPVQGELALNLKVVRNDLTDCDGAGAAPGLLSPNGGAQRRQPIGMVWNRLSARLLMQAATEFNVVQKERGKLLSQAGDGSGGARRS
jgi:hypothetical protein